MVCSRMFPAAAALISSNTARARASLPLTDICAYRFQSNRSRRGGRKDKAGRGGGRARGSGRAPGRNNSAGNNKISQSSAAWLERQSKDQYAKRARNEGSPSRAIYKLEQIDELVGRQQHKQKSKNERKNKPRRSGLFQRGDVVIDLGAAPGGWCLNASKKIGPSGKLIAVDLLPLDGPTMTSLKRDEDMADFYFVQGDFNSLAVKEYVADALYDDIDEDTDEIIGDYDQPELLRYRADVVLNDMAANFTGDQRTDALRTMALCETSLLFAAGSTCFIPEVNDQKLKEKAAEVSIITWQDIGLLRIGGSFLCKFFQCGKENEEELIGAAKRLFSDVKVIKPPASRKESAEQYLLAIGYQGTPLLQKLVDKY